MKRYSTEQQVLIVKTRYKNGAETIRKLCTIKGHNNAPNESTVGILTKKFEKNLFNSRHQKLGIPSKWPE
ncbi:hypothetical protein X975_21419, partial [Stegodyphus mimosarum]